MIHHPPRIKTLVVGGGGFIGSHFVRLLANTGKREIMVTGRSPRPKFMLPETVRYVSGDVGDISFIGELLNGCEELIDLAYATVPKTSFDDPVHDVLVNLPTTVSLLRQACNYPLRRLLLVSSGGTVYGNSMYLPVDEAHPTNPVSPYGITKLAAEKYALLYHRLAGLPVVIARPSNPYGPNQLGKLGQGFIGAAMFAILKREKVVVFGEHGTVRDYIYVEDLAEGLLAALEHGVVGEIYNVSTGIGVDNMSILKKLEAIVRASGFSVDCMNSPERSFDVAANVLSSARLTYISGWRAKTEFLTGLERTWTWALEAIASK